MSTASRGRAPAGAKAAKRTAARQQQKDNQRSSIQERQQRATRATTMGLRSGDGLGDMPCDKPNVVGCGLHVARGCGAYLIGTVGLIR